MTHEDYSGHSQRLYRDTRNGWILGVCAGFADYFGWNPVLLRVLAVIALCFFPPATFIVYFVLGFALPKKPARFYDRELHDDFWQDVRRSPTNTFHDLRHRFRQMDRRLQRMEAYVTSRRYDLDRQFRDLED
jgi:phage shock protein C